MKKLLTLIAFAFVTFTANAQSTQKGDVNGDGDVSVNDVAMIVNYILGIIDSNFIIANADVNGDGEIDINDVMSTVSTILEGNGGNGSGIGDTSQAYLTCPDDNHPHMIDLGMPDGTKWACCNVGADKPEAYGGYYAWGETEEKTYYGWSTYIHCEGEDTPFYLGDDIAGTKYDVAHVKWGGKWVMPSWQHLFFLWNDCTFEVTTINGVKGALVTGPNGGTIFLPAAGYRWYDNLKEAGADAYYYGYYCYYWSVRPDPLNSGQAEYFSFGPIDDPSGLEPELITTESFLRIVGFSVRPVWLP